jgi:hypothetical protein
MFVTDDEWTDDDKSAAGIFIQQKQQWLLPVN